MASAMSFAFILILCHFAVAYIKLNGPEKVEEFLQDVNLTCTFDFETGAKVQALTIQKGTTVLVTIASESTLIRKYYEFNMVTSGLIEAQKGFLNVTIHQPSKEAEGEYECVGKITKSNKENLEETSKHMVKVEHMLSLSRINDIIKGDSSAIRYEMGQASRNIKQFVPTTIKKIENLKKEMWKYYVLFDRGYYSCGGVAAGFPEKVYSNKILSPNHPIQCKPFDKPQSESKKIRFNIPFKKPPKVFQFLKTMLYPVSNNYRLVLTEQAITTTYFNTSCVTWKESKYEIVDVEWIAIETATK